MNKRKLRRVAIVALVLVLLCNTLGVQASTKKDDPTVIVKDYGSLYTAIAEAKDNDVIGIQGTITIPAIVDLNMSENKAVILRRMEAGAKLVVSGDYGADNKASFRMISFDGNSTDVGGTEPFVEINGDSYNISISASEGQESQIQPVNEVSTVNTPESTTEPQRSPNWIEYITVILLAVLVGLEIKDKLHKEK